MIEQREKQRKRGGNHPENLKPCKKGETHNPKGYSKSLRERYEFRRLCQEMWESGPKDVVTALQEGVRRRKFDCIKEAGERFFGKVPSNVKIGGDGEPIKFEVVLRSKKDVKNSELIRKRFSGEN